MSNRTPARDAPSTLNSRQTAVRRLTTIRTPMSLVLVLPIASASIPRPLAYDVFLGTTDLVRGIGGGFLPGVRVAFYGLAGIVTVAARLP